MPYLILKLQNIKLLYQKDKLISNYPNLDIYLILSLK